MALQKRYNSFTLSRTPFWLFFLAGASAMTLAPLFNSHGITIAGILLAASAMAATAAARLRDMGCSAWFTPFVAIPLVALYAGLTASDEGQRHPAHVELRVLTTSFLSTLLPLSWMASLVIS